MSGAGGAPGVDSGTSGNRRRTDTGRFRGSLRPCTQPSSGAPTPPPPTPHTATPRPPRKKWFPNRALGPPPGPVPRRTPRPDRHPSFESRDSSADARSGLWNPWPGRNRRLKSSRPGRLSPTDASLVVPEQGRGGHRVPRDHARATGPIQTRGRYGGKVYSSVRASGVSIDLEWAPRSGAGRLPRPNPRTRHRSPPPPIGWTGFCVVTVPVLSGTFSVRDLSPTILE